MPGCNITQLHAGEEMSACFTLNTYCLDAENKCTFQILSCVCVCMIVMAAGVPVENFTFVNH